MGKLARQTRPPASGAIIFYGRSLQGTTNQNTATSLPVKFECQSTQDQVGTTSTETRHQSSSSESQSKSQPPDDILSHALYSNPSLEKRGSEAHLAVLKLASVVLEVFEEVPYVKIVAGLVQRIITIYDEIKANQSRARELSAKVFAYGRVVFEALLALNKQHVIDFSGIKDDLTQIANVLQSIYGVLQSLADHKSMSRLKRVINRDDIAAQLAEQDRRLETTITAFQLKSMIVVRSVSEDKERDLIKPSLRPTKTTRRTLGLRSKPQIIHGRNKETDLIVETLLETREESPWWAYEKEDASLPPYPPRVCILGPGGIGKTTVALSVLHHELVIKKFKEERFFVSCEAAATPDLFLDQLATCLELVVEDLKESILKAVIRRLKKDLCVLVLDNFETTWDATDTRSEIEAILAELMSTKKTTIILTMRGSQKPNGIRWSEIIPPLQPVDFEAANSIFKAISHKSDEFVSHLIKAVDCVPLAVTLIATLASVDSETTESLWSRWQEENTSMIENGDDRLNSLETSVRLSLSSPRMQRGPGALLLLSTFSLLPDGISLEFLRACERDLPDVLSVRKALSTLRQNALVYEDTNKDIRILSPIRLFMKATYPPSPKMHTWVYNYFLKLANSGVEYQNPVLRSQLQREANNINFILLDSLESSSEHNLVEIVKAILHFCHYTYISGSAATDTLATAAAKLDIQLKRGKAMFPPVVSSEEVARTKPLWRRAFSNSRTSKDSKVLILPMKEQLADANLGLELRANCLGCWGQILSRQCQFSLAQEKFEGAKELHVQARDISGHAYDLLNIGMLLSHATKWKDATDSFKQAFELHEKLNDVTGKAYDLLGMGNASRDVGEFNEAQKMMVAAAKLFTEIDDRMGRSSALSGLGSVLLSLSKCSEAEGYFSEAANICNILGDSVSEADNVAGLAVTFLLRSRFLEAQKAIQKAISLRHPFVDADHIHLLGRICIAMGDYEQAHVHLSNSFSYHEDVGDPRGMVDDMYYLATIEFHRGELRKAKDMAWRAYEVDMDNRKNPLVQAEIYSLLAQIQIRDIQFWKAGQSIRTSLALFESVGCTLGVANCMYVEGIMLLRQAQYDAAMETLTCALDLHTEVDNVQGQADDLNKICEVLLLQNSLDEANTLIADAMSLHLHIGDKDGQASDLYIKAGILLARGLFLDAESTIRKAIELHQATSSSYGLGRDYALLSDITWQLEQRNPDAYYMTPRTYLKQAMEIFQKMQAVGEFFECRQQQRRMKGKEPQDPNTVSLPDWVFDSDEEEEEEDEDEEDEGNNAEVAQSENKLND